ncbi:4-hydroxy-tetrahydrodipicolinate synthase [Spirosoma sp. LMG 31448]|uniref:4-hydroxy-tetrahydrodipicolinate synthase n=1 Tax=Spirosoma utsteinense TaxID=2585773 RepID=A0ABR6W325_9BACT|nr:dihydrodipicolinate synthase family protein [Spirosoma utsteinense]MBC3786622.1 4-hydroxy-tetrahydrodipicolinate synthase [Spirosoma utsteinense]MBC3790985.1 4-hydroxy-tetrahydrodipicolinate synthase [Spirosoma utsteinense]
MAINWQGVFPALTTKFTVEEELDLPAFITNLQAQLDAGVDGIILGGSLGEASTLSNEEKNTLVQTAVEYVDGQVPVVLNIAEGATREAVRIAKEAVGLGVSGLMLLPPMRYKADERETCTYFKAIATATDLPIMLYNNPIDYKIEVTLAMFDELIALPTIQAVKESTRDVSNVTRLRNRFGDRVRILCGVDTLAMEELVMGADGWVAGLVCAFPRETVAVYKLVKAGRIEEARAIYRWFLPLLELDIHPKLVQYIKLAEVGAGIGTEHVRAPRLPLVGTERDRVLAIINEGLANRPELPQFS